MFVVGIGEGVCVYLYMRIYGLMIVKWGGGCGCGGGAVGQKSGGGQRQSSHYGGRVVCESGGWAALMDSLWGGRDLRLTWGYGVW